MITARKNKYSAPKQKKPLLFKLTRRTILFLLLALISQVILFIIGNYQLFLDSSQRIIMSIAVVTSTALAFLSVAGIIEAIFYIVTRKQHRIYFSVHLVLIILTLFLAVAFQFILNTIRILASGL